MMTRSKSSVQQLKLNSGTEGDQDCGSEDFLKASPRRDFEMLLAAVSYYAVYTLDENGVVSSWNTGAERNKGYTSVEAVGMHFSAFYTAEDREAGEPSRALAEARSGKYEAYGWRVRKDGSQFWAHVVIEPILDSRGRIVGFAKVTCDVTAQKIDRDQLVSNLDAALSNMSQILCLFDAEERLLMSNRRLTELFKICVPPGTPFAGVIEAMLRKNQVIPAVSVDEFYRQNRALTSRPGGGSMTVHFSSGIVASICHRPLANGSWVTTVEDISDRHRSEEHVLHMAFHDTLTDLPNRALFRKRIDEIILRSKRGALSAVLFLDLDDFKTVNDTLGHSVGDQLLVCIATRLGKIVRETDTVARLGGDEFAIVLNDISDPSDAIRFAQRVLEAFEKTHEIDGHIVTSGVSVGIAFCPLDSDDPEQLLKCADLALYKAKALGRGDYCFFEKDMDTKLQERRLMELDLRNALKSGEFQLHYQPLIDVQRDIICSFEALVRWNSPKRGLVNPADFIPLAEEMRLIVDIGAWVLEEACREAQTWPEHIKIAVNVSVVQFKGNGLVDAVRAALEKTGLSPRRLEIEITESVMMKDSAHACQVLHAIKAMGVSVAMDDFGTGYSSLGYIRSFPFDKIKIDRSFVSGLGNLPDCNAIVQAVLGICESLGIIATAEGVETEEQLSMLRSKCCHQVQGYLISRPVEASQVPALLAELSKCGQTPFLGGASNRPRPIATTLAS